jgi:Dolichyl-phosphate-mannose-protein mannosyltransferase
VEPRSAVAATTPTTSVGRTLLLGAGLALIPAAIDLIFLGRYGWHRDERYFLSAARHPSFGYVDFPPLTAWIGRAVVELAGPSLDRLRVATAVASWSSVVFAALIARELGGSLRAQAIAAATWACSPLVLGAASIFHPTMLDIGAQVATLWLATRAIVREDPRVWLPAGIVAGVGIEAKYTILLTLAALAVALAVTRQGRRHLRSPFLWAGVGVAAALWVPNLGWQLQHGWPSLAFSSSQRAETAADTPPLAYVAQSVLFAGAGAVLAIVGVHRLWRRDLAVLALVPVLVYAGWLLERGRGYYPVPALAVAVAAGAIAAERRPRLLVGAAAVGLATLAIAGPVVVPMLPQRFAIDHGYVDAGFFKDEFGWPELADQAAAAWRREGLRPDAAVLLAANYGEAGALAHDGPARGLPPALSGHLSWQYWRPAALPQRDALTVGFDATALDRLCSAWHVDARIANANGVDNEERGRLIARCRLVAPLGTLWDRMIARTDL